MDINQKLQFKDFCESTSLHGWGFMALGKFKPLQMVFWSITVLLAFCLCAFFIGQSTDEYMNGVEFKTETLTESLDEVYFPAVSVSSSTEARLSTLLEIVLSDNADSNETTRIDATKMLRKALYKPNGSEQEQQQVIKKYFSPNKMKKVFWDFVHENQQNVLWGSLVYHNHSLQYLSTDELDVEFQKLHPWDGLSYFWKIVGSSQLSNILAYVQFRGQGILHYGGSNSDNGKPRNRFLPYFGTPEDRNYLRSYPKKAEAGRGQGFIMWLDVEVFENIGSTTHVSNSDGFKIGIGHPFDFETLNYNGVFAKPGMTSTFGVSTSLIHTDRQTFRKRISISKSNCYFEGEVQLDHFPTDYFRYSMTNCLNEALFQKVETLGNCTPIWAPIVPKGSQRCTGGSDSSGGAYLGTFDTIMSNGTEMTCHANCIDQPFIISLHYTSNFEIRSLKDICRLQSKILESCKRYWKRLLLNERYDGICEKVEETRMGKCNNTLLALHEQDEPAFEVLKNVLNLYAKENIAVVNVYLVDPYVKKIVRDVKVSFPQLISNIGGNLGLWQGMSVISLVELLYFFMKWLNDRFKGKKNTKVMVTPST